MFNPETAYIMSAYESFHHKNRQLGGVAAGYFIRASLDHPVSATAQGARIALLSKESGQDVADLHTALMHDQKSLQKITDSANRTHRRHGVSGRVSMRMAKDIVQIDFLRAGVLAPYPDSFLTYICSDLYDDVVRSEERSEWEDTIRKRLRGLLPDEFTELEPRE